MSEGSLYPLVIASIQRAGSIVAVCFHPAARSKDSSLRISSGE